MRHVRILLRYILWAIESGVRIRDSLTVTQRKAYWIIPNGVKDVPYEPIKKKNQFFGKETEFPFSRFKFLNLVLSFTIRLALALPSPLPSPSPLSSPLPSPLPGSGSSSSSTLLKPPNEFEMDNCFASLDSCPCKPAILSLVKKHSSGYIPKSLNPNLPMCLSDLFKSEYLQKNYGEILKHAEEVDISITQDKIRVVESETRSQAKSPIWFRMRTGRITASRFKSAAHCNPAFHPISLIMSICHPELAKFKNVSTCWGCEHEKVARE